MYLLGLQRAKNRIELKKAEAGCGRSQVSSDQACSAYTSTENVFLRLKNILKFPRTHMYI